MSFRSEHAMQHHATTRTKLAASTLWCAAGLAGLGLLGSCGALDKTGPNRDRQLRNRNNQAPAVTMAPRPEPKPQPAAKVDRTPGLEPLNQGQILKEQGLPEQALQAFERAIADNPELTLAYMGAGDIYRERGDHVMAQKRYEKAAEIEPRNFDANYFNGLMLQLLNRVTDAVTAYLNALQVKPEDFNANLNVATAYLQLGEPAQAVPYGEKAVRIDSQNAAARINLGAIYAALNRHQDAVVEYQQAAELTDLSGPLLMNLASSLGRIERYEEMLNTLDQLLRVQPSASGHERKGFAYFKLRRYDKAMESYRAALTLDSDYYPALNGVGVCLLNQWHWSGQEDEPARMEALRVLRRSLQVEKNQPKILELISMYQ